MWGGPNIWQISEENNTCEKKEHLSSTPQFVKIILQAKCVEEIKHVGATQTWEYSLWRFLPSQSKCGWAWGERVNVCVQEHQNAHEFGNLQVYIYVWYLQYVHAINVYTDIDVYICNMCTCMKICFNVNNTDYRKYMCRICTCIFTTHVIHI